MLSYSHRSFLDITLTSHLLPSNNHIFLAFPPTLPSPSTQICYMLYVCRKSRLSFCVNWRNDYELKLSLFPLWLGVVIGSTVLKEPMTWFTFGIVSSINLYKWADLGLDHENGPSSLIINTCKLLNIFKK